MSVPLEVLRCPISGQTVQRATEELVRALQDLQRKGSLRNRSDALAEPFETGLVSADGNWFFPVRGGIPVMLASEAVALRVAE
jgi:uncharacterized protein YbaR (Trm112 family)